MARRTGEGGRKEGGFLLLALFPRETARKSLCQTTLISLYFQVLGTHLEGVLPRRRKRCKCAGVRQRRVLHGETNARGLNEDKREVSI